MAGKGRAGSLESAPGSWTGMEAAAGLSVRAEDQGLQRHRPAPKARPVRQRKQDTQGKGPGTASRARREQEGAGVPRT